MPLVLLLLMLVQLVLVVVWVLEQMPLLFLLLPNVLLVSRRGGCE